MGASVQAAVLQGSVQDVLLLDVIPLSIGIRTKGDVMAALIPRNSTIPTEFKDIFSTAEDNQPNVDIQIYQGERAKASENKLLGKFTLDGIPPAKAGTPEIEVSLNIDADGVLNVSAKDLKTGRAQKVTVKANGGLSEDEVARMLKDAEANAEKDRIFRETLSAQANADYELKTSAKDPEQEWFKAAPQDLKDQFAKAVKELTEAQAKKDTAAMVEKTNALKSVRTAIGEAFTAASQPKTDEKPADAQPEAAGKDDVAPPKPQPPAPPAP
jgi:molecular chaperone DnaK